MMRKILVCLLALMMCLPCAWAEEKDNRYDAMEYGGEPGWVCVQRDGLWGVVDSTGVLVIPCEWDEIGLITQTKVAVCRDEKWGWLDLQGNVLLRVEWDAIDWEIQGYFNVGRDNLWGLMDADGTLVMPLEPGVIGEELVGEESYVFRGLEPVDRRYYVIENGEAREVQLERPAATALVVPDGYKMVYIGYAADSSSGRWVSSMTEPVHYRFADREGDFLTEDIWDEVGRFCCGLSKVKKDGKVGFVNEQGESAIPLVYDGAWDFSDDMTLVRQGDERFWIDTQGNRLFDWEWAGGSEMIDGVAVVRSAEGLYVLIDREGNLIDDCKWDDFEFTGQPFMLGEIMRAEKGSLWGFVNKQGVLISGRLYDPSAITVVWSGDSLFLLEDGVLSIWHADGTQVY